MKKSLLPIIFCLFCFSFTQAQEFSFGFKGGVNYAMGGEIVGRSSNVDGVDEYSTGTFNADSEIGFHGGAFIEMRFGKFLVRPEAMYVSAQTQFTLVNTSPIYTAEQFTIPLLVGYNIYGPIDVYAGPAYNNIIEATLENAKNPIVVQNSPLAAQAGIKAGLGRFELDLRYSRSMSSTETQPVDIDNDNTVTGGVNQRDGVNLATFDGRLHHVFLSLSFKLFDSSATPSRRGGGCYF